MERLHHPRRIFGEVGPNPFSPAGIPAEKKPAGLRNLINKGLKKAITIGPR